jgi:hypothetical protein
MFAYRQTACDNNSVIERNDAKIAAHSERGKKLSI